MQSVDLSGMEKFSDELNKVLEEMPGKRRELHEQLATLAKQEVDSQIGASLGGDTGKIAGWQEPHVGSGGGYAAVRATNSSSGADSPGAITNYLENGHAVRRPSGNAKRYRPEINQPYVDGRHFYQASRAALESKAIEAAKQFADELSERLNEA